MWLPRTAKAVLDSVLVQREDYSRGDKPFSLCAALTTTEAAAPSTSHILEGTWVHPLPAKERPQEVEEEGREYNKMRTRTI